MDHITIAAQPEGDGCWKSSVETTQGHRIRPGVAAHMMMGLSLCSPMETRMSSVNSFPAPAKPISTVGCTCSRQVQRLDIFSQVPLDSCALRTPLATQVSTHHTQIVARPPWTAASDKTSKIALGECSNFCGKTSVLAPKQSRGTEGHLPGSVLEHICEISQHLVTGLLGISV